VKLPDRGPWPHTYYETPGEKLDVTFRDTADREWKISTYQKVAGSGPPLVLVHGLMTSSYSWRFVIADLARHYKVYVPDLVGSGQSDKPPAFAYTIANVGRFIAAYIQKLGIAPAYVVGNSLGGLYCARAIHGEPAIARRFILMHSPGFPQRKARLGAPALKVLGWALPALFKPLRRFVVAKNVHYLRTDMLSKEEVTEYSKLFETSDGRRSFVRILKEAVNLEDHAAFMAELRAKKFPVPSLCLFSKKDVMVPPEFGPPWAEHLHAPLHWIDEASHFIHVDQPKKVVEEIVAFDRSP